jgi:hypothetical protein
MCLSEESYLAKSKHCLLSRFCSSRSRCLSVFCRGPFLCSGAHKISLVGEAFLLVCFFCFLCGVCFAPNSFCWIFSGPVNVKYMFAPRTHTISLVGEVFVSAILLAAWAHPSPSPLRARACCVAFFSEVGNIELHKSIQITFLCHHSAV